MGLAVPHSHFSHRVRLKVLLQVGVDEREGGDILLSLSAVGIRGGVSFMHDAPEWRRGAPVGLFPLKCPWSIMFGEPKSVGRNSSFVKGGRQALSKSSPQFQIANR